MTVLAVHDLRMRYGDAEVVRGVTFDGKAGEVIAILGPNGAGKTTTLEILEGFRARSGGDVAVLGTDPARADDRWRARVGVVLQSWRDHGRWRVRELLAHLGAHYAPYTRPWPVDDLLSTVGLAAHAHRRIGTLSGGQRRRLDVAIGVVGRPALLFLDEPTAGFDPQARRELHALLHGLAREHATTILLTTHDLPEAERLADRIIVLDGGRIVAEGTAAALAHAFAGDDEVRWCVDGQPFSDRVTDSTGFVRDLFTRHGAALTGLEVRPASLEETYLALVRRAEGLS